jgi:hypothetical protein
MLAALSFYDVGENRYLLTYSLERLGNKPRQNGNVALINLQLYPALLVLYTVGISALSFKRFDNLAAILLEPKYKDYFNSEKVPAIDNFHVYSVFDGGADKLVPRPNAEREYTAANNYIFDVVKSILHNYLPDDNKYEETFDLFEYLLALTYWDLVLKLWAPIGRFGWRYKGRFPEKSPIYDYFNDGLKQKAEWGLLKAGFFGGSVDQFTKVSKEFNDLRYEITKNWH